VDYRGISRCAIDWWSVKGSVGFIPALKREAFSSILRKKRSTWIDIENHNDMWISEYIPFDHRVTTTEELRSELNDILDHTPDFDALFEATEVRIDELHTPVFG
jgi:hypothetical protein